MSIALEGTIEIVRANVKLVRTRLGMTVLQFAKAVNVGSSTIGNFETGGLESISDRTISRIALGVGLTFEDLTDPALKDRYRPSTPKTSEPAKDDPLTAEFKKMLSKMNERQLKNTLNFMRFQIWSRENNE